jgi:hypothetical protein
VTTLVVREPKYPGIAFFKYTQCNSVSFLPFGFSTLSISFAEPHYYYAASAPDKNFDAGPASTLVYKAS